MASLKRRPGLGTCAPLYSRRSLSRGIRAQRQEACLDRAAQRSPASVAEHPVRGCNLVRDDLGIQVSGARPGPKRVFRDPTGPAARASAIHRDPVRLRERHQLLQRRKPDRLDVLRDRRVEEDDRVSGEDHLDVVPCLPRALRHEEGQPGAGGVLGTGGCDVEELHQRSPSCAGHPLRSPLDLCFFRLGTSSVVPAGPESTSSPGVRFGPKGTVDRPSEVWALTGSPVSRRARDEGASNPFLLDRPSGTRQGALANAGPPGRIHPIALSNRSGAPRCSRNERRSYDPRLRWEDSWPSRAPSISTQSVSGTRSSRSTPGSPRRRMASSTFIAVPSTQNGSCGTTRSRSRASRRSPWSRSPASETLSGWSRSQRGQRSWTSGAVPGRTFSWRRTQSGLEAGPSGST